VAEIPVADQAFGLRSPGKICDQHIARGNVVAAAAVLQQAAKEQGGMFTNKREASGPNGGPIHQVTWTKTNSHRSRRRC
jgi:hypothetical protein